MERGMDFLKSQVNNAVMQHGSFCSNLVDHESLAEDSRFRDLCTKYIPVMQSHQRMLEDYQRELGADPGAGKKILGKAFGVVRELADAAREDDFFRLVGDIVMSRQSEDTFKTFREAGKQLGIERLREIGDVCERDHDRYADEANRLCQMMFVEHVRGVDAGANVGATIDSEPRFSR
jgi:hypothetical protein